jgi:hypothetical protein
VNWPAGVGGKGNAGVAANVSKIAGRDRLRRVCVREAEQDDATLDMLNRDGKTVSRRPHVRRRRRRRRLEGAPGLRREPEQPAGRRKAWPITAPPSS